jgi:exosortase/archaeosortase family protein
MAAPIAVFGNIARITTVIIVGDLFGQKAGAMIEQKFGFITFVVALGCVLLIGKLLKEDAPVRTEPPASPPPAPSETPAVA